MAAGSFWEQIAATLGVIVATATMVVLLGVVADLAGDRNRDAGPVSGSTSSWTHHGVVPTGGSADGR